MEIKKKKINMKKKIKSKQNKLVTPIIINNENPDEMPKLIRPTPIKIDKKDDAQNINKNIYNFKINENKTYNSESSCSYSK